MSKLICVLGSFVKVDAKGQNNTKKKRKRRGGPGLLAETILLGDPLLMSVSLCPFLYTLYVGLKSLSSSLCTYTFCIDPVCSEELMTE